MTIQLQKFSSETIYYIQDVPFIVKGFTTKLFLQTLLNSVIYETFPIYNFYAYGRYIITMKLYSYTTHLIVSLPEGIYIH